VKKQKNQTGSPLAGTSRTDLKSAGGPRGDAFVTDWQLPEIDRAMAKESRAVLGARRARDRRNTRVSTFEFPWRGAAMVLVVLILACIIGWVGWEILGGLDQLRIAIGRGAQ